MNRDVVGFMYGVSFVFLVFSIWFHQLDSFLVSLFFILAGALLRFTSDRTRKNS